MVTASHKAQGSRRASLMTELLVAMALLTGLVLPVAYSFTSERRYARAEYQHAVAMEIVDGEMEALLAGYWQSFPPGTNIYAVTAAAATNLPPGQFLLIRDSQNMRLEWRPAVKHHGGVVVRDASLRGTAVGGDK
jgi:hypothetical protein